MDIKLDGDITRYFRLLPIQKKGLERLKIKTPRDLLFHYPARYEEFGSRKNIRDVKIGESATIVGEIISKKTEKTWKKKLNISSVTVRDATGIMTATWFHQPYVAKMLEGNTFIALTGKITAGKSGVYLANPEFEKLSKDEVLENKNNILAIYPETRGITSRWIRASVKKILSNITDIDDPIPGDVLKRYNLPSLHSALIYIHTPRKIRDAEAARKRLSFDEVFFIQLGRLKSRAERDAGESPKITTTKRDIKAFMATFPFKFTKCQTKSIDDIVSDMTSPSPMSRLLEGDVGSGKTAVAIVAAYIAVSNGYQVAYMAPTEILARQHFDSFIEQFAELRLTTKVGLLTSPECRKYPSKVGYDLNRGNGSTHISRAQLLKSVSSGEIPILIGTHSLIQKTVEIGNLALAIIDEQHRFGTNQRAKLVDKGGVAPHLLSMTATPIPRTLALTIYGDLDISLLDEMPVGRKKITTKIVPPNDRSKAYEHIRKEIKNGRQAYIICPRIEEPDEKKKNTLNLRAVITETKRLCDDIFPELIVAPLHGKMSTDEKSGTLDAFKNGEIDILVATSVIEVGINVPNATMILIEGAERFGLAQLHQLRGRVMRSNYQPYCFIFTDSKSAATLERLSALTRASNGFELAEYDLKFRGAGELSGAKQWGVSDVGMEALKNLKMVEAARNEARKIIKLDPKLDEHSELLSRITSRSGNIHFE